MPQITHRFLPYTPTKTYSEVCSTNPAGGAQTNPAVNAVTVTCQPLQT